MSIGLAVRNTYVRRVVADLLREKGMGVHEADSVHALEDLLSSSSPPEVLVVDMTLEGLEQAELRRLHSLASGGFLNLIALGEAPPQLIALAIQAPHTVKPAQLALAALRLSARRREEAAAREAAEAPPVGPPAEVDKPGGKAWAPRRSGSFQTEYMVDRAAQQMEDQVSNPNIRLERARPKTPTGNEAARAKLGRVGVKKMTREEFEAIQREEAEKREREARAAAGKEQEMQERLRREMEERERRAGALHGLPPPQPQWKSEGISLPSPPQPGKPLVTDDYGDFLGSGEVSSADAIGGISLPNALEGAAREAREEKCPQCGTPITNATETFCGSCGTMLIIGG